MSRQNYSEQVERAARQIQEYAQVMTGRPAPDLRPMLAGWEVQGLMERYAQAQVRAHPPHVGKRR